MPPEGEPINVAALVREKIELEEKLAASQSRVQELESPPAPPEPAAPTSHTFVAPAHLNEKVLVKAGVVKMRSNPGSPMDMAVQRDGDIWARFQDGILVTEDPLIIAWCVAHPEFCRDAADPQTKAWAILVEAQTETSSRDSRLPKNMDIGRLLAGDVTALAPEGSIVDRALRR